MQVFIESDDSFLPKNISESVISIIRDCLESITTIGDQFIINDTLFYREQKPNKFTPCVVNSATYISSKFQAYLDSLNNAQGETTIQGQSIDGFIKTPYSGIGYVIKDRNRILEVLHGFIEDKGLPSSSVYTLFPMFYGMFVERSNFGIEGIPTRFIELFQPETIETSYRVGVEFETGNIASSFRALNKLFVLYQKGEIEAGVFVTCIDKRRASTRIWPQSNRNGSFQELISRNYKEQVSFPLISIGFAPDGFSDTAPLLGKNGDLYVLSDTGNIHSSEKYAILTGEENTEILSPI